MFIPERRPDAAGAGCDGVPSADARSRRPATIWTQWWRYVHGACWLFPGRTGQHDPQEQAGPSGSARRLRGCGGLCAPLGRQSPLPTEAEWNSPHAEGSTGAKFTWGDDIRCLSGGSAMANTWFGEFPWFFLMRRRQRGHDAGGGRFRRTATGCTTGRHVWEWSERLASRTSDRCDQPVAVRRSQPERQRSSRHSPPASR